MAGEATFKAKISILPLAKQAITVHIGKNMVIRSFRYIWLVHSNADRNALEITTHGEQKPFNIGDMAATYLKHFSTHLSGKWMPPTLVRRQVSDGEAYILC